MFYFLNETKLYFYVAFLFKPVSDWNINVWERQTYKKFLRYSTACNFFIVTSDPDLLNVSEKSDWTCLLFFRAFLERWDAIKKQRKKRAGPILQKQTNM